MNGQAIKITNQGSVFPSGTVLPVDSLSNYIFLRTDGGQFPVPGREGLQEAFWRVLTGADIAKLPSEILANMKFESGHSFAVDADGDLMLYVRCMTPDYDVMLDILEDAGIGQIIDKVSAEHVVQVIPSPNAGEDPIEVVKEQFPAIYDKTSGVRRISREQGMALLDRIKAQNAPQASTGFGP